jgi:excisionase family DNA binding protein
MKREWRRTFECTRIPTRSRERAMKTFDLFECADFLKVDRNTVLKLAGTGEIPGAKIGRAWVFLEDDVVAFLRKRIGEQTAERIQGLFDRDADDKLNLALAREVAPDRRRPGRRRRSLPALTDSLPRQSEDANA